MYDSDIKAKILLANSGIKRNDRIFKVQSIYSSS